MAQAVLRPAVRGPTFVRLLARLAEADVAAPGPSLPDRLGQWLDWNHALSLAAALDGRPAPPERAVAAPHELAAECARARETLAAAIRDEPPASVAAPPDASDFAPHRQACLARQRAMQAAVGRLRGRLRDALMQAPAVAVAPQRRHARKGGSPRDADDTALARLAEIDAVMEAALTPREHRLLARVPVLLERRFERLRAAGRAHWPDTFRRDMQDVLLAELDLRFQPVDALLAALRRP